MTMWHHSLTPKCSYALIRPLTRLSQLLLFGWILTLVAGCSEGPRQYPTPDFQPSAPPVLIEALRAASLNPTAEPVAVGEPVPNQRTVPSAEENRRVILRNTVAPISYGIGAANITFNTPMAQGLEILSYTEGGERGGQTAHEEGIIVRWAPELPRKPLAMVLIDAYQGEFAALSEEFEFPVTIGTSFRNFFPVGENPQGATLVRRLYRVLEGAADDYDCLEEGQCVVAPLQGHVRLQLPSAHFVFGTQESKVWAAVFLYPRSGLGPLNNPLDIKNLVYKQNSEVSMEGASVAAGQRWGDIKAALPDPLRVAIRSTFFAYFYKGIVLYLTRTSPEGGEVNLDYTVPSDEEKIWGTMVSDAPYSHELFWGDQRITGVRPADTGADQSVAIALGLTPLTDEALFTSSDPPSGLRPIVNLMVNDAEGNRTVRVPNWDFTFSDQLTNLFFGDFVEDAKSLIADVGHTPVEDKGSYSEPIDRIDYGIDSSIAVTKFESNTVTSDSDTETKFSVVRTVSGTASPYLERTSTTSDVLFWDHKEKKGTFYDTFYSVITQRFQPRVRKLVDPWDELTIPAFVNAVEATSDTQGFGEFNIGDTVKINQIDLTRVMAFVEFSRLQKSGWVRFTARSQMTIKSPEAPLYPRPVSVIEIGTLGLSIYVEPTQVPESIDADFEARIVGVGVGVSLLGGSMMAPINNLCNHALMDTTTAGVSIYPGMKRTAFDSAVNTVISRVRSHGGAPTDCTKGVVDSDMEGQISAVFFEDVGFAFLFSASGEVAAVMKYLAN